MDIVYLEVTRLSDGVTFNTLAVRETTIVNHNPVSTFVPLTTSRDMNSLVPANLDMDTYDTRVVEVDMDTLKAGLKMY